MRRLDELHLRYPFMGAQMLRDQLNRQGIDIGRKPGGDFAVKGVGTGIKIV